MHFSHQAESRRCIVYGKGGEAITAQHIKSIKGLGNFQDLLFYTSLWQKDQGQGKLFAEDSLQIVPKKCFKRQSSPQMRQHYKTVIFYRNSRFRNLPFEKVLREGM